MSAASLRALVLGLALFAPPAVAQESHAPAPAAAVDDAKVDIITPHITDGYHMELPYWAPPFYKEVCIGRHVGEHGCEALWGDVQIGPLTLNFSPTKHVVPDTGHARDDHPGRDGSAHARHTMRSVGPKGSLPGSRRWSSTSGTRSSSPTSATTATPSCHTC
jgi:hypothetical protein